MINLSEKLDIIAENEPKVYEAGRADENKAFWDNLTNNNTRTFWEYGFYQGNFEYIRPPYKISVGSDSRTMLMFSKIKNLKRIEKDYFDLSQANIMDGYGNYAVYRNSNQLEVIEDVGLQPAIYYQTFAYCQHLHTIELIRVSKENTFSDTFSWCYALENVTFEGEIGKSIDFKNCPLNLKSAKSVITHLVDYDGLAEAYVYSVTFSDTTWAYLDADEGITNNGTHYSWRDFISRLGWEA